MIKSVSRAAIMLLVMTLLTGVAYPLAITVVARVLFERQANGSMIEADNGPAGSALIGQKFTSSAYFHGRPSAAGEQGYDGAASSGSNKGPTSKELLREISSRAARLREENGLPADALVPADLVTASGSGLDPHISPAAAYLQVPRVARARGLPQARVRSLAGRSVEAREFGILGEARVNVLRLNLELDRLSR